MTAGSPAWQPTLFGDQEPSFDAGFSSARRRPLDTQSWIDVVGGWVTGADELFAALREQAPWAAHRVHMYDRVVDEPRLRAPDWDGAHGRPAIIDGMTAALSERYGIAFTSVGFNLYRDGNDSVAWHGDRVARERDTAIVAVVSLGGSRPFLLRPTGGGPSIRLIVHSGDLVVMGGACQRRWQHAVPKVRAAGPRISVTFRHDY